MDDLTKIPFGFRVSDQQYVDVVDVPKGKLCGCICPSCKMPLQARQGKVNQWHFAHSSRGASKLTEKECDFSFWVSVLSMAKQIISKGGTLTVPSCTKYLGHDEIFITDEKEVQLPELEIEKGSFDAYYCFGKYSIGLNFTTPEKEYHATYVSNKGVGVLEISLSRALNAFFDKTRRSDFKNILKEIIFQDVDNKKWIYHPKIEYYINRYGERLQDKPPYDLDFVLGGMGHVRLGCYECVHCKLRWRGIQECPDCHNRNSQVVKCR
ncbi:MAG: hypothetical protein N838_13400 [Thiohalocapsa sp. PB-PSB1]|nr:MAG: hypothetical protein N838_13400 [Thiohalocapsa sp. PB-PSB1]